MPENKPALERANANWGASSILDATGNRMQLQDAQYDDRANRNTGGTGGGGDMIAKVTLEQNVKGLNIVISVMIAAFGAAFLFILGRIDTVADKVADVRVAVAQQSSTLAAAAESMARIEGKLGDTSGRKPDTGAQAIPPK